LRARLDPAALDQARDLASGGILDWAAVRQAGRDEGVIPLLYWAVRGRGLIPAWLEQAFAGAYLDNALRNVLLWAELEAVLARLTAAGVSVVLLKGAALGEMVYRNLAVRPMADLDLLVHCRDVAATFAVLGEAGYTPGWEMRPGFALRHAVEMSFRKEGAVKANIEVHWHLFNRGHHLRTVPLDWFWETARPLRVGEACALALGPEAQVIHLCAHLFLHHRGQGLMWWHDIAEVIHACSDEMDWQALLDRAQAYQVVLPLQRVLIPLAKGWKLPLPAGFQDQLGSLRASPQEARLFAWLNAGRRPGLWNMWAALADAESLRQEWEVLLAYLFPSVAYMRHRYAIASPWLVPFYYPYRWLSGLCCLR
jgi:hypothetical protein